MKFNFTYILMRFIMDPIANPENAPVAPVNDNPVPAPASVTENPVNANVAIDINQAAIVMIIKSYTKFLLKNNIVSDKDALKSKIAGIIDAALNNGKISVTQVDCINGWVDSLPDYFNATMNECMCKKSLKCVFKILAKCSNVADPDIEAYKKNMEERERLLDALNTKFGEIINSTSKQFIEEFKAAFDPKFVEEMSNFFN